MQISEASPNFTSHGPVWFFIAEFSLNEFMLDQDLRDELTTGLLFQKVRGLDIPPECVENIEMTLTGFIEESLLQFTHGNLQMPGCIRVFCQKKMLDLINSKNASRPYHTGQAIDPAPIIHQSNPKMNGGWGYFLVERGGNISDGSTMRAWNSVDLYLYHEGE